MKRVLLRPGKTVVVSDQALARAREGMKAFGVTPETMAKLGSFKGDTTIGPKRVRDWAITVSLTTGHAKAKAKTTAASALSGMPLAQTQRKSESPTTVVSSKRKTA